MTTWQRTRSDKRKFLADIKANPGKTYYSVRTAHQPWGNEPMYYEIAFKPSRLWGAVWGHMDAAGVLANYGPITDVKPRGMRGVFDEPTEVHLPDAGKAVQRPRQKVGRR